MRKNVRSAAASATSAIFDAKLKAMGDALDDLIKRVIELEERVGKLEGKVVFTPKIPLRKDKKLIAKVEKLRRIVLKRMGR